jgi:uncharacterized protein YodC (DUF2158 family)
MSTPSAVPTTPRSGIRAITRPSATVVTAARRRPKMEASEVAKTNEAPFEAGDLVRLKSGGPKMTVTAVSGGSIVVSWFPYGTKQMEQTAVHPSALEKVPR